MAIVNRISHQRVISVQCLFVAAFGVALVLLPGHIRQRLMADALGRRPLAAVSVTNHEPATVSSLNDDINVVSDEQLAAVIRKVLPRFDQSKLRPNYVEHALRIWGSKIAFANDEYMSGSRMVDFLLDSGAYTASWGDEANPILEPNDQGVRIRWGKDSSASVHHDHMLASLAEASVPLTQDVFTPSRRTSLKQIFTEALRDFRLDERETEWSTMAFAHYLMPQDTSEWHNSQGRRITFDLLASRLIRGTRNRGVCLGTHRVFSLMALLRMNEQFGGELISNGRQEDINAFLNETRQLIIDSQDADGSWPPNWYLGKDAAANKDPKEKLYRRVIATGHHLEWLAIAPERLQPPREVVIRAAAWLVGNVESSSQDFIDSNYTYYSHAANALALWRGTTIPEFWDKWRSDHPTAEKSDIESTGNAPLNP